MNKTGLMTAMAALLATAGVQAVSNGMLTINGFISTQTCNAVISGSNNATLTLPTMQTSRLSSVAATAGQISFTMDVTGCGPTNTAGAGTVKAFFEKGPTVDANGRLINTATGPDAATNVELQLVDGVGNAPIVAGDAAQNNGDYATIAGSAANLPYSVRYYATGMASAGTVTSSVAYALIYK